MSVFEYHGETNSSFVVNESTFPTLKKSIICFMKKEMKWLRNIDTYIVNAINKRIITTVAHCQPVTAEPKYIDVFVLINIFPCNMQHIIQLQWKPANAE